MIKIIFEDIIYVGADIYCLARYAPVIMHISLLENKVVQILRISNECTDKNIGRKIFYWRNSIVITPGIDDRIKIYNLGNKSWKEIYVPNNIEYDELYKHIFCSELYEDTLFMFGCIYHRCIKCNLKTGIVIINSFINGKFPKTNNEIDVLFSRYSSRRIHDKYVLPFAAGPYLLEFDLRNEESIWRRIDVANSDIGFRGMAWDGVYIWAFSWDMRSIIKIDEHYRTTHYTIDSAAVNCGMFYATANISNLSIFSTDCGEYNEILLDKDLIVEVYNGNYTFCKKSAELFIAQNSNGDIDLLFEDGAKTTIESSAIRESYNEFIEKLTSKNNIYSDFLGKTPVVYEGDVLHFDDFIRAVR